LVNIGKIVSRWGRHGEIKLRLYLEFFPKPFFPRLYLKEKGILNEFETESIRSHKDDFLLKLKTIDSMEKAIELSGLDVFVPEEHLRTLEKDNYYLYQIIGLNVVTKNKKRIGTIEDLVFIENNDLLIVNTGEKEVLIPFTRSIVLKINLAEKEVVIDPPDGLLELNEI
jgi:16S rRNA processing protein RimM